MNKKFCELTDYEVYMIKRALIEASGEVFLSDIYNEKDKEVYTRLLNDFSKEDKERSEKSFELKDEMEI